MQRDGTLPRNLATLDESDSPSIVALLISTEHDELLDDVLLDSLEELSLEELETALDVLQDELSELLDTLVLDALLEYEYEELLELLDDKFAYCA